MKVVKLVKIIIDKSNVVASEMAPTATKAMKMAVKRDVNKMFLPSTKGML